ncbi:MAG TPA: hemerythrin domain-containing protein [Candidatus Dormibacteraeota bacterium]|nr:hemerythrin domain-containing protein [Candidatus Dormibacteraeota bacterium]
MNAITLLETDHRNVEALFKQIGELGEAAHASRQKLFKKIDEELTVHSKVEETIFYPALKAKAEAARAEASEEEVLEAYEEHGNIKGMLKKLEECDALDETYNAKLEVLSELVKHHVHEEEHEMFAQARRLIDKDELDSLGERITKAKEHLLGVPA